MDKIKILYVEDEKFLGQIVKESLEGRGYEVCMEADGIKAIESFREFHPEICVLDVMLPRKDGFTLAKEIRTMDPAIPIIFLTAKTQTEDVLNGFRLGANDYIRKPFSLEELIVRIENALRIPPAQEPPFKQEIIQIGNLELNTKTQVLLSPNGEKKLSYRECALLVLLESKKEEIIERKFLMQTIWKDDSYFNSRNLDVYITRMRAYLKSDPRIEIITIKGQGYRFIIP